MLEFLSKLFLIGTTIALLIAVVAVTIILLDRRRR